MENSNIPVKIDLRAELKAKIPEKQAGQLAESFRDAISPFTETLGIFGDHFRFHKSGVRVNFSRPN